MTDQKRPYHKKRRAELEEQTRRRITQSAVELHGTLGPALTSMSAVAEHAGVRRSTLYRHFPDEEALFQACSSHWRAENPPADLRAWAAIADADERLRVALGELYPDYRRTQQMRTNLLRDEATHAITGRLMRDYHDYLAAARDVLVQGRTARGRARARVQAAIGHALAFATWRSLAVEQGLDDDTATELMCRLVSAAADPSAAQRSDARRPRPAGARRPPPPGDRGSSAPHNHQSERPGIPQAAEEGRSCRGHFGGSEDA